MEKKRPNVEQFCKEQLTHMYMKTSNNVQDPHEYIAYIHSFMELNQDALIYIWASGSLLNCSVWRGFKGQIAKEYIGSFMVLYTLAHLANWGPKAPNMYGVHLIRRERRKKCTNWMVDRQVKLIYAEEKRLEIGWRWEKIPSPLNPAYTSILQN